MNVYSVSPSPTSKSGGHQGLPPTIINVIEVYSQRDCQSALALVVT
jgi:hypothetical protein